MDEIWEVKERIPRDVDVFFGALDLEQRFQELEETEREWNGWLESKGS